MEVFPSVIGLIIAASQSDDWQYASDPADAPGSSFIILLSGVCCVFIITAIVIVIVLLVRRNTKGETFSIDENTTRTMPCVDCGGIVSRRADKCPHCGAPANQIDPQSQDQYGN